MADRFFHLPGKSSFVHDGGKAQNLRICNSVVPVAMAARNHSSGVLQWLHLERLSLEKEPGRASSSCLQQTTRVAEQHVAIVGQRGVAGRASEQSTFGLKLKPSAPTQMSACPPRRQKLRLRGERRARPRYRRPCSPARLASHARLDLRAPVDGAGST
jgi:hypothetical protein